MKAKYIIIALPIILASCNINNTKSDAYGNFEATEILIGAEVQGRVTDFSANEGQILEKGFIVGCIDTLSLNLRKLQTISQKDAATARLAQVQAQINVQEEQRKVLNQEQIRISNLVKANAVPAKQQDDINGQLNILNEQIASTRTQNLIIANEIKALKYQVAQVDDQLSKSVIRNPINGTLLEKYIEVGEIAVPGKSLYKIADLTILKLRVFVSGAQLPNIKIGQKVKVFIDKNENQNTELEGTISWISEQAEFTPKIIQTKEERVNLVYAVKIDVVNNGSLKIGMPGEIKF
jgi:HlyD family secretion protein